MTLNLRRAASELAEKIAALPARYPYIGAAEKNVYLFTPTEAERDLIVQALCAFAAAIVLFVSMLLLGGYGDAKRILRSNRRHAFRGGDRGGNWAERGEHSIQVNKERAVLEAAAASQNTGRLVFPPPPRNAGETAADSTPPAF